MAEELQYPNLGVYACDCGCGRYVIAGPNHERTGYWAPVNDRAAALTGCSGLSAKTIRGLTHDGNARTYSTRRAARRAMLTD